MLEKEDIEFIKNLSHEMKTQDTRCTAQPYGLIILEKKTRVLPQGFGDEHIAVYDSMEFTFEELLEFFEDDEESMSLLKEHDSLRSLQNSYEAQKLNIDVYDISRELEANENNANFFLTEKAYYEHIKRNGHNLSEPQSYGIHLFRNAEMKRLVEVVHKLAEVLDEDFKRIKNEHKVK